MITLDPPLYAIAKRIQWNWPEQYGENRFVIILGGLHIEMAGLKVIGDWLEDSSWVQALVQAQVASAEIADSFLKVCHATRTRHAHQVTVCAFYILLKKAYAQHVESLGPDSQSEAFDNWCEKHSQEIPQFQFWYTTLQLELLVLMFVKALRTADFSLYVDSLTKLAPWFFCLDHINYARWVPIHIQDMVNLNEAHPNIAGKFNNGNFTFCKTKRMFSSIAIDQAHEQHNAIVKGDGGAVGLTQNPEAFKCWLVAGPEMARVTAQSEASIHGVRKKKFLETRHHEQTKGNQVIFVKHVKGLVEVMEGIGNPFMEESKDLLRLDSRDIIDPVVDVVFTRLRMLGRNVMFSLLIGYWKNQYLFQSLSRRASSCCSDDHPQEKSLRQPCRCPPSRVMLLYFQDYLWPANPEMKILKSSFIMRTQCVPRHCQFGKLRLETKYDILHCLESIIELDSTVSGPDTDVTILDRAVVVNFLKPLVVKTFEENALNVFLPYIEHQLQHASRIDIGWDQNLENSLKCQARNKRGNGIRRKVDAATSILGIWQQLQNDANKTELFAFLVNHTSHLKTAPQDQSFSPL